MVKKFFIGTSILAAFLTTSAQAFEFGKSIRTPVVMTQSNTLLKGTSLPKKEVTVTTIKLTPKEQQTLFNYRPKKHTTMIGITSNIPHSIDLGMNNVPVLDQGIHGSCVTFAVTAALDALLGKGDYVSQLCNLELGSYLENQGYMLSGWEGSFGSWMYDQVMRFGIVSKENQRTKTCAGVSEYPTNDTNEGNPMSLAEFKQMSEDLSNDLYPVSHMNFFQRFDSNFEDTDQAEKVLRQVKESLAKGHRSTIGTILILPFDCSAGACASFHANQDTWALTKEIEEPPFSIGGHEMVIIGYDDKAVAIDKEGKKHQGLLILRNSWGNDVGDAGNYYMTYDYFKKFAGEIHEIVPML